MNTPKSLGQRACSCWSRSCWAWGPVDLEETVLLPHARQARCVQLPGEPLLASAALDRLTHRAHFLEVTGPSYRAEQTKQH